MNDEWINFLFHQRVNFPPKRKFNSGKIKSRQIKKGKIKEKPSKFRRQFSENKWTCLESTHSFSPKPSSTFTIFFFFLFFFFFTPLLFFLPISLLFSFFILSWRVVESGADRRVWKLKGM